MPAYQYDGRPSEEKKSEEISRPTVQRETPAPEIFHEPAEPAPQREQEKQEQSHGYGY